jgi:FlaA1/EpsC-like NDP-sugar epimerase
MKLNIFDYSRTVRTWLLLVIYTLELFASLWISYELRFDFMPDSAAQAQRLFVLLWLVPLQLLLLGLFHQLRPLLGYFSTPDLARMFHALSIGVIITLIVWGIWGAAVAPPRGVIVIDFLLALVGLTGVRLAMRTMRESMYAVGQGNGHRKRRVGIIGAGDAGAVLAHELSLKPGCGIQPVAFFDDDPAKWHSRVHDIPVLGPPERLVEVCKKLGIEEGIIAMPSAAAKRVGEVVRLLRHAQLQCRTVPSLDQIALGQIRVSQLRNVEVQDLLGREKVELATEDIRLVLEDRVVLVTGAGGSIGSELCRQIATYQPKRLLLLDRSEPNTFQIEQELIGLGYADRIVPIVADIMDRARMAEVFSRHHPEVVFHAAAHKHVPMMEHQPGEAIRNNFLGTAQLADMAVEFEVDRFTLISTDKAINPTSVMGVSKRLAELYVQARFAANHHQTKFMAVRFGNVLGSTGSVIPIFRRQIAEGGPVKVTHPDMTRYFMTIPEASMLVLQSATQGQGGEIFVLDMGQPVRIVDLARQMIELSGLKPDEDIQIEFIGIRPGEKLFEELRHTGENFAPTAHPKIRRFLSQPMDIEEIQQILQKLQAELHSADPDQIKCLLRESLPDYVPHLNHPEIAPSTIINIDNQRHVASVHEQT